MQEEEKSRGEIIIIIDYVQCVNYKRWNIIYNFTLVRPLMFVVLKFSADGLGCSNGFERLGSSQP